ncbi:protein kinase domain-containing protein [Nocardia miyunensis]|uniref:protein kinase domain-containing protein n=1 Tax=Nocardia miyunensis TaxID=282684 RepID=UPI000832F32D|nr:protein kinase [Nocardia miyunensis]
MSQEDPFRTLRDLPAPVTDELSAAGFTDAQEIGRGGFGVVYRCTQAELDRTVAVKILTAELDATNRARFFREQQAMGQLTGHPNIVTVLQVGVTAGGRPYLVMPYHPLDSLEARIRKNGPLPTETALWIGVKIAGALDTVHHLGIVHRDVKPGNILLTDYGEPALTDFGIARIPGGFQTDAGMLTGSPAFTAPEVLEGETPTAAADVYGLGATLFCALTGHAAFERRSGENVVTQFLRITSQPVPDLRESSIDDDVAALVATAMTRAPAGRPTAAALGETIRQAQRHHGFAVDAMALHTEPRERRDRKPAARNWSPPPPAARAQSAGSLPLELTSFINRRTEVAEARNLLTSTRLLTLAGVGGVGKTRLALRVATAARREFADGVWFVEFADVSDPSLLVDVVAVTLGLRDEPSRSLQEVVVEYLSTRQSLLVLDNCEQVVAAVAALVETLLQDCPDLRVLATSREPLDIAGESVLRVSPLTAPATDRKPSPRSLPRYDAVTLFTERAAAVVPGFEPTDDNKSTIARICARLDGLPLAIELAAARMRTMSPEQILQRLDDRYSLLTRASRTAPHRQQTLRWCIDWSYQLCTPVEQQLWARLSVFSGRFELDAAEQICGAGLTPGAPLDALSSLVDKSVVIREESRTVVRFRMLDTVRDYGRDKLQESNQDQRWRRRHCEWYQRLVLDAEAEWMSDRQPYWIARLERELANLRDAFEYSLAQDSEEAAGARLRTAAALLWFSIFRGLYSEFRRWIERAIAHPAQGPVPDRVKALNAGCVLASMQSDLPTAADLARQARVLTEQAPTPMNQALTAYAEGHVALYRHEHALASRYFERTIELLGSNRQETLYIACSILLGWVHELTDDHKRAIECYEKVVPITEACGETLFQSSALWAMGVSEWAQGGRSRAVELLENSLRVNGRIRSPLITAADLEALAWIARADGDAERAAILLGAVQEIDRSMGTVATLPLVPRNHEECVRLARAALGERRYDSAIRRGRAMDMSEAIAYALGERPAAAPPEPGPSTPLTKREQQVANLIARGLTNKQIATELVISLRTAQGHVEHILSKLGFTSRAQVAAWITEGSDESDDGPDPIR